MRRIVLPTNLCLNSALYAARSKQAAFILCLAPFIDSVSNLAGKKLKLREVLKSPKWPIRVILYSHKFIALRYSIYDSHDSEEGGHDITS